MQISPMISIIVPIYKTPKTYLLACLNSLMKQTADPGIFEILLIDDNNHQDEAGTICEEFASLYAHCFVYHKENGGVSSARNLGITHAKGDYLCFLDADDWLELDAVETMAAVIKADPTLGFVLFSMVIHFPATQIENKFWDKPNELFTSKQKQELQLQLYARGFTEYYPQFLASGNHAKLYRRSLVIEHHLFFSEQLTRMEDNVFNLYFIEYAQRILFVDSVVHHYRKNNESVTNRANPLIIEEFEKAYQEIDRFQQTFGKPKIYEEALTVKRLVGIHNYYDFFWKRRSAVTSSNPLKELLNSEPYVSSLDQVNTRYLTSKEKIYVSVLKTKNYTLFTGLHRLEALLKKITGQRVDRKKK